MGLTRHRDPIPNEARVVWSKVVVAGTERRQRYAGKKDSIGPLLPAIPKHLRRSLAVPDDTNAHQPDESEGEVRQDVQNIRNAKEGPRVDELVISEWLRNGFTAEHVRDQRDEHKYEY